ncbi:Coproporphyrinogen III oxidase [Polychytrium aggregatum]|uniref:Coproporphyrinogen III oxidase n=1 Tax=Polychytrium aggregatum TaxID=110093 RepID=UPI0022FEFABB|nr:Coproporphyrinogen III oxidase [Polychytrium aggregatum]KAI9205099.1 Coproporphyrinogen III oxidase [Polychytrium aggregatum]
MRTRMEAFIRNLQLEIVEAMESLEGPTGAKFLRDTWERPNKEEGGGISCVLNHGKTFEKAAVLVSAIHGRAPPQILSRIPEAKRAKIKGPLKMYATGMSLVIHPLNPMAPTSHCNYRYIEVVDDQGSVIDSWFGGGSDLTPTYVIEEDAVHFHRLLKDASDPFDPSYYQKFKVEADKYFWIPHRQETRGVGGIFFDDFRGKNPEHAFAFVRSCGSAFVPMYQDIVAKRKDTPFTEAEKEWQMLRRGRYAEFNLVIDKGVKFGLVVPQARVESILASLPGSCKWEYMHSPVPGSREDATLQVLKNPRDWV